MAAVLRAQGADFNLETFLSGCSLPVCTAKRRGEPVLPKAQPNGRRHERSGIHVLVSHADFQEFRGQVGEATAFLRANAEQIRRLVKFPGIEGVTLDFGIARRDVFMQYDHFPAELVQLAGSLDLAIEPSQYPIEEDGDSV
jgi:hypothetical protein